MDIFRLNPDTYLPDMLLENYTSMIWTERYLGAGEFEFKTPQVFPMMEALPEGCLLSLRDSDEVMIVETRSIGVDGEGGQELTIVGRSFETFLENRVMLASVYNEPWITMQSYTISEMACLLYWNHLINTTGEDITRPDWTIDNLTGITNSVVTESVNAVSQSPSKWWLEAGSVYPSSQDFLNLGDFGVRTARPNKTTGVVVTFNTSRTASRGAITKTIVDNIPQLRFDIYNGYDRTRHQTDRPSVIFHYDSGHIDDPKYLFSTKEYQTMATVTSSIGNIDVYPESVMQRNSGLIGIERKTLFVDGGDIGDVDYATFVDSLIQKGQIELKKHAKVRLFDGAISPISPYEYKTDYFLGDYVTLLARFGFDQTMRVSEYVRTEDAEGDRGYPGLSSLAD